MKKVVLASGKVAELTNLLTGAYFELVAQSDLGIEPAPETSLTFVENAITKARHACATTELPAIADDSGLVVRALAGAPGIHSARYAGEQASDRQNIDKLLWELREVADDKRQAIFHCVLVYIRHQYDPIPLICSGSWHGKIVHSPVGDGGCGYDPVFYVPTAGKTAAEMSFIEKQTVSHRAQALSQLLNALRHD